MRTLLRRCAHCDLYTLRDTCPSCSKDTLVPTPARFSPEDRHGKYRRKLRREGFAARKGEGDESA